jgi:predicted PurR-regulated permease PerM
VSSTLAQPYRVVLAAICAGALVVLVALTAKALLILFGGCLFALVLRAVASGIARRTRLSYALSLTAVVFAILTTSFTMLVLAGPKLHDELVELTSRLPAAIRDVLAWLRSVPIGRALAPTSNEGLGTSARSVAAGAFVALGTTLEVLGALAVVFFVGVYGAAGHREYTRMVLAMSPVRRRRQVLRALHRVSANLTRWLLGRLVAMLFVGVTCAIAFSVLHVPLAMSLAVLAGLLTFIEYVGAVLSAIPPVLLAFTHSPTAALAVLIVFAFLHLIEGYVLTPLLARASVRFPPALTLAGQVVFATLVGPLGLTFSTPLLIVGVSAAGAFPFRRRMHLGGRLAERARRAFRHIRREGPRMPSSPPRPSPPLPSSPQ